MGLTDDGVAGRSGEEDPAKNRNTESLLIRSFSASLHTLIPLAHAICIVLYLVRTFLIAQTELFELYQVPGSGGK